MKKYYQVPGVEQMEMDEEQLMNTISTEGGNSDVRPGEGGTDLSRGGRRVFVDED